MKELYFIVAIIISISSCTKDKADQIQIVDTLYNVEVLGSEFAPSSLTINVGDTVRWTNSNGYGFHNVNGTTVTYPANLESFGNSVNQNWTFEHIFNTTGSYDYQCDAHVSMGMTGKIIVN